MGLCDEGYRCRRWRLLLRLSEVGGDPVDDGRAVERQIYHAADGGGVYRDVELRFRANNTIIMTHIIIDRKSGFITTRRDLREIDMQLSWDNEIIIINPKSNTILFGSNWLPFKYYNELVESGEAVKLEFTQVKP